MDPSGAGDAGAATDLPARVEALRALLREVGGRGLTREERAGLATLAARVRRLLEEMDPDGNQATPDDRPAREPPRAAALGSTAGPCSVPPCPRSVLGWRGLPRA